MTRLGLFFVLVFAPWVAFGLNGGAAVAVVPGCILTGGGQTTAGDTFSGNARDVHGETSGNWHHMTPAGDLFHADVTFLSCRRNGGGGPGSPPGNANIAEFEGTGTWNGQPGYEFAATVHDHGEGNLSNRLADDLAIVIVDPDGVVVVSGGGLLESGNVQVHEHPANPHP